MMCLGVWWFWYGNFGLVVGKQWNGLDVKITMNDIGIVTYILRRFSYNTKIYCLDWFECDVGFLGRIPMFDTMTGKIIWL